MAARLAFLLLLAPSSLAFAEDPKPEAKPIPAAEAKDHLDKEATFEMVVRSSKDAEKSKVIYLDSEVDYKDPKTLVVVISYDHLDAFKKAKIDEPAKYYLDKTIRVTGTPRKESDQIRIRVEDPKSIKVIEAK